MTINLEELTPPERTALLEALITTYVRGPLLTTIEPGVGLLAMTSGMVAPGSQATVNVRVNHRFTPRRLIILEPSIVATIKGWETRERTIVTRRRWWQFAPTGQLIERYEQVVYTEKVVTVPRAGWRVLTLYVGDESQFRGAGVYSGDAFGFDNILTFDGATAERGYDINLVIDSQHPWPATFLGLIVGTFPDRRA